MTSKASTQTPDIPLGAPVSIIGVLVGRSEFSEGPPSYLVEYGPRGKRIWVTADELEEDADDE